MNRNPNGSGPVTLHTIAQQCGVSRISVSRALSGQGRLAPETRRRILEVANELGYRPNSMARTMRSGRFGTIGVMQSDQVGSGWLPASLLSSVHNTLARYNLHLIVARVSEANLDELETDLEATQSDNKPDEVPRLLREWACDGLLINYIHSAPPSLDEILARCHVPGIRLNVRNPNDCIHPDDFGAAQEVTRQLMSLGHREIAFVDYTYGSGLRHYSNQDRKLGFESAMREQGLEPQFITNPGSVIYDDWVELSGQWLKKSDAPTAVVAYSESEALTIYTAALKAGLEIPRQLSLVTFHCYTLPMVCLNIGGMILPEEEMGHQSVEMLLAKIEDPTLVWPERAVPCTFNPGKTIAPPVRNS